MRFRFTPEQVEFLSSDRVVGIREEYRRQAKKYADSLRIQTTLRGEFPDLSADFIGACMEQFRLQERGSIKCTLAPDALYTADALEMASSAETARLHAALLPSDGILLDIAAGK